jgi:hypothetical protein
MSAEHYVFQGIRPYIAQAAADFPDVELSYRGRAERIDGVTAVGHSLTQATLAQPEHRADIAREAERQRDVLALALAGVEAAILDVYSALELPAPRFVSARPGETTGTTAAPESEGSKPETAPPPPPEPEPPIVAQTVPEDKGQPTPSNPKRGLDTSSLPPPAQSTPPTLKDDDEPPLRSSKRR